jgi:putative ABC transport system permease protein
MLLLARKNLFSERIRLIISVGGVALSVFLITVLISLYRGWDEKVGLFVEESDVDVWIGTEGTNDFLAAASLVPTEGIQIDALTNRSEVEEWSPIIVRPIRGLAIEVSDDGERTREEEVNIHMVGYDPATGMAGPVDVVEGSDTPGNGEVIIDKALQKRYGVGVGDLLEAGGREWKIVGISDRGDFVASQTVFVNLEQAQSTLGMQDSATYIGVRLTENYPAEDFVEVINSANAGAVAFTRGDFADNTRERILGNILPILTMVLALAFIVGLAVAGLTIYTATIEKAREYGILKAVGFKNSYLYRLVFEQSMTTGAIGFAIGMALTLIFAPFASDLVPQFVTLIRWQDVGIVFLATVLMSAIAGYVPVRRLATIDPTSVFKA